MKKRNREGAGGDTIILILFMAMFIVFAIVLMQGGGTSDQCRCSKTYRNAMGQGQFYTGCPCLGRRIKSVTIMQRQTRRVERAEERVLAETCMETVAASFETPDFVEVHGLAGGDDVCYRVYDDGRIYGR